MKTNLKYYAYFSSLILAVFLLAGCITGKWETVKYQVLGRKSFSEQKPKVQIISMKKEGNNQADFIIKNLKQKLSQSKKVEIVESDPMYIIDIEVLDKYRKDSREEQKYNTEFYKETIKQKNSNGEVTSGRDIIEKVERKGASAFLNVGVALYDVNNFEPFDYFTITTFDSQFIPVNSELKTDVDFYIVLAQEVIKKMQYSLIISSRNFETYIPNNIDKTARKYFSSSNKKELKKYVLKKINTLDIKQLSANIKEEKYKDPMTNEKALSLFYLYLISLEQNNISLENLRKLYFDYAEILNLTDNDALVTGCANSINRVEHKWKLLSGTTIYDL